MTTYTKSPASSWSHSSHAGFREWGKAISDGLAAVGMVQTADTGNDSGSIPLADWATVERPGTNTDGCYEIWRFDDAQQSSQPIYIKIAYGTGSSAAYPRIRVWTSSGSDGSGNLTGTPSTGSAPTIVITGSLPIRMSLTDGCLAMFVPIYVNPYPAWFIERTRDASGAPDARGYFFSWINTNTTLPCYLWRDGAWTTVDSTTTTSWPATNSRILKSGNLVFFSGYTPWSGDSHDIHGLPFERTLAHGAISGSLGVQFDTVDVPRWDGETHTYMCTGVTSPGNTNTHLYFLWE